MMKKRRTKSQPALTRSTLRRSGWILIALASVSATVAFAVFRSPLLFPAGEVEASQAKAGQSMPAATLAAAFGPTISNATPVPAPSPQGMAWIPGGEFSMGAMDPPASTEAGMHEAADARPIHRVYVDAFWIRLT